MIVLRVGFGRRQPQSASSAAGAGRSRRRGDPRILTRRRSPGGDFRRVERVERRGATTGRSGRVGLRPLAGA